MEILAIRDNYGGDPVLCLNALMSTLEKNPDLIKRLGGAGKEDFLVTPYLNNGISGYGDRISIERKSGKQTYTGAHFKEAIQHSIEKGATYSIIV
jgi:hypothetical protein